MDYFKISKFFLKLSVLCVAIVTASTLFPFIVGKYVWFRTSVDLSFIFFLIGLGFGSDARSYWDDFKKVIRSPLVWMVTAFVAIFLLAGIFGVNPHFSFWSNFERGEGGFQIIHLYAFFLLCLALFRGEKDWRSMMKWFLAGGMLMVLYGIGAGSKLGNFIGPVFGSPNFRFEGSIGNPAYVAVFSIFMLFYALYLVSDHRANLKSPGALTLFGVALIFLISFFAAATRGAFIGLVAAVFVFLVYFAFGHKSWRKWAWMIGGILLACVVLGVIFQNSSFVQSIPGSRVFDLSLTAQTLLDRTVIWKMAWDGFLARPILGWGPENFLQVFSTHFNTSFFVPDQGFGAWFDRAHSLIFDYLVETGILGFLAFAGIFVVFFRKFFQSESVSPRPLDKKSLFEKGLILTMPVAYLIQGLVLFDVLPTYINIFFFLAFAAYLFNQHQSADTGINQRP